MQDNSDDPRGEHLGPIPRPYTSGDDDEAVTVKPPELARVPLESLPTTPYDRAVQEQGHLWQTRYED